MNKIKFLILSLLFYCPHSHCSFNFTIEDMLKSSITIENKTVIKVAELGIKFDKDVDTHLIGRTDSKQYSKWLNYAMQFRRGTYVENKLSESSIKTAIQDNSLIIERDFRLICRNKDEAMPLLELQFQELMDIINRSSIRKAMHVFLTGKVCIYGIDDPDEWVKLPIHLKEQECKKLRLKFGCEVRNH